MQFTQIPTPIAQIKISVAKPMDFGTIIVHGINKFASLFTDALILKVGDNPTMDRKKNQGKGESKLWGSWVDC